MLLSQASQALEAERPALLILLLLLGTATNVAAANGPSDELLEPNDLVERVLSENAGLAAMRSAVDAAEARIEPAGALPDPQLSGAVAPETIGGFETPSGRERSTNIRFEVSQDFPWPGTLGLRADAARKEALAADDNVAAVRLRLASATRSAYAEWYYVHQALEILQCPKDSTIGDCTIKALVGGAGFTLRHIPLHIITPM